MDKLVRCISTDGTLVIMAAETTDMVEKSQQIHKTSAVTSAALGRLLTASSLMGSMLLVLLLVQDSQCQGEGCNMRYMRDIRRMHIVAVRIHVYGPHIQDAIHEPGEPD